MFDKDIFDGSLIMLAIVIICIVNTRALVNHVEDAIFGDMHLCYWKCFPDNYFGYLFSVPVILSLKIKIDGGDLFSNISPSLECQSLASFLSLDCHPKLPTFE